MKIKYFIFFSFSFLTVFTVFGQDYSAIEFIENKGQWNPQVQFMGTISNGSFFIQKNGFTVLQHNSEDLERLQQEMHGHGENGKATKDASANRMRSHAYKVQFLNAANEPVIVADKGISTYNNYFIGNDPSKWATNCKVFQGITIKNIYPKVDVRYYSHNGYLKYDLIVQPGADLSQIALRYDGVDKLEVKNGELNIQTSVGVARELYPYSYQWDGKGKKEVAARYKIQGNTVRFEIKDFNKASTLIIDPTMIFASYAGSRTDNWGFTATYGADGSMYGGGIVAPGNPGFPVSPGAFQTQQGGDKWDIGIIKLTPDGSSRVYATYIGGSGIEQPHSLVVDGGGNLVLAGRTNSQNYPTTGATGLIGRGGAYDIVVTKLNAAGSQLIGSKKIGGAMDDGANISSATRSRSSLQYNYGDDGRSEVVLDGGGNIYVASCTQSNVFPGTAGTAQPNIGGMQDGVVLKLTPDVSSLIFATFLGGDKNDAAYVLALEPSGSIYVAGGTESQNFPKTSGGINGSNVGGIDGFVSIISNNGSTILQSTYIGTGSTDQVYGIQLDRLGFPYIMGQTTGSWPIIAPPTNPSPWSQPGGKQFIAKLQPDLSKYIYSTVFGTPSAIPNISPVAFLVDRCENVYVSGWGGTIPGTNFSLAGTLGLTRVNSIQNPQTNDGQDFYFFVLKRDATAQLYGDFYGQNGGTVPDHVDGGTSRFDANGVIYQAMCANCGGGNFPGTPGAWAVTNPSPNCNLKMLKIALNLAGLESGVQAAINGVPRDSSGCVPLTVDFTDTVSNAVSYEWDFGDGSPRQTTTTPNLSHTYTQVGSYPVMLVAIDPNSCNIRDTSYTTIRVGALQALPLFQLQKFGPCESFQYQFTNTSIPPAARPFNDTSFIWDFGDGSPRVRGGAASVSHSFPAAGTYNVKLIIVDTGYCNAPDSLVIPLRVAATVKAAFTTPVAGCAPYDALFDNKSQGGQQFFWDFGDGTTSTMAEPTHTYTNTTSGPLSFRVKLTAIDSATCNIIDSTSVTVTVYPKPLAAFTISSPQPPPVNTPIIFDNISSPDAIKFKWFFGDGDSLLTKARNGIQHEYNSTKTYTVMLIAYNANNCSDTAIRDVQSVVQPAVDVPNAFTPQSGDINNTVLVRGYAINKLRFIIWNRWGQKVFETNSKKFGWDGKYKGVLQPMDVYAYTLEVEFSDGTKATKKGDITLIR